MLERRRGGIYIYIYILWCVYGDPTESRAAPRWVFRVQPATRQPTLVSASSSSSSYAVYILLLCIFLDREKQRKGCCDVDFFAQAYSLSCISTMMAHLSELSRMKTVSERIHDRDLILYIYIDEEIILIKVILLYITSYFGSIFFVAL